MEEHNFELIWSKTILHVNSDLLRSFSSEIFSSMCYDNLNRIKMIDLTFLQKFINVPLSLCERIFDIVKKNDDFLEEDEFCDLMCTLYYDNFDAKIIFFFRIFDFDNALVINKRDVIYIIRHIDPLALPLIDSLFKNKNTLSYEEYIHSINSCCDIVLFLFNYISNQKIFCENILHCLSIVNSQKNNNVEDGSKSPIKRRRGNTSYASANKNFSGLSNSFISTMKKNDEVAYTKRNKSKAMTSFLLNRKSDAFFLSRTKITSLKASSMIIELLNMKNNNNVNEDESTSSNENNEDDFRDLNVFENDIANSIKNFKITLTPSNNSLSSLNLSHKKLTPLSSTINVSSSLSKTGITFSNQIENVEEYNVITRTGEQFKLSLYGSNFLFIFRTTKEKNYFFKLISIKGSFISVENNIDIIIESCSSSLVGEDIYRKKDYFIFSNTDDVCDFLMRIGYRDVHMDYTFLEEINHGKFGIVLHAKHHNKDYAIKIIEKSPSMRKQNRYEIWISEYLMKHKHPNIIDIVDVYEDSAFIYIVMKYILHGEIQKNEENLLLPEQKIDFISQIIDAVSFLHLHGIIHRDIKMNNILISNRSPLKIKLIDFGLSLTIFPSQTISECCGTMIYSAPEITLSKPYNNKVDIWSIGVIAYVMKYGELPVRIREGILDKKELAGQYDEISRKVEEIESGRDKLLVVIKGSIVRSMYHRLSILQIKEKIKNEF